MGMPKLQHPSGSQYIYNKEVNGEEAGLLQTDKQGGGA